MLRRKTVTGLAALRKKLSRNRRSVRRNRHHAVLDFVFEEGLFFIEIINTQDHPLFDVQIGFDKKITGVYGTKVISRLPLFRHNPFLAPRKVIRTFLDSSHSYFQRREPTLIRVGILYKDADKKVFFDEIVHDLSIYREIGCIKARPAGRSTP